MQSLDTRASLQSNTNLRLQDGIWAYWDWILIYPNAFDNFFDSIQLNRKHAVTMPSLCQFYPFSSHQDQTKTRSYQIVWAISQAYEHLGSPCSCLWYLQIELSTIITCVSDLALGQVAQGGSMVTAWFELWLWSMTSLHERFMNVCPGLFLPLWTTLWAGFCRYLCDSSLCLLDAPECAGS